MGGIAGFPPLVDGLLSRVRVDVGAHDRSTSKVRRQVEESLVGRSLRERLAGQLADRQSDGHRIWRGGPSDGMEHSSATFCIPVGQPISELLRKTAQRGRAEFVGQNTADRPRSAHPQATGLKTYGLRLVWKMTGGAAGPPLRTFLV